MSDLAFVQDVFTKQIPKLESIARFYFRKFPPDLREESIHNSLTLAWKYFLNLFHKGRAEEPGILNACLRYSVKQTREGRMLGKHVHTDVFDLRRSGKVSFQESNLEDFVGNRTPIAEQVSFRIDVPAFLDTLTNRQRAMALDLAMGVSTGKVAQKHHVTPGAVSQFRTRFKKLYDGYFGE
jgi:hypothetical protein